MLARLCSGRGRAWLRGVAIAAAAQAATGSAVPVAQASSGEPGAALVARAVALEHGEGVARDPEKAAELYCQAARLGNPRAMHALGWMYANGRGIARNDAYAGTLFAMAAQLGHPQAAAMRRFTGYSGQAPDCLRPPHLARAARSPGDRIPALSGQREALARLVVTLADEYAIDPRLALAIALTESGLNPLAVSPKSAMGVMQLIPATAERFNVRNPYDPEQNIRGGLAYLRWLLAYFRGDIALAAAGYNAGEGAVDRYRGIPPYPETRAYVERILAAVQERTHPYDERITRPSAALALPNS